MIAKTIGYAMLLTVLNLCFALIAFAGDPPAVTIGPDEPTDHVQMRIELLRKQGKNEEAARLEQLEIVRGQALAHKLGVAPFVVEQPIPYFDETPTPDVEVVIDTQPVASHAAANIPKPQRVRSLMAAAASLKAAGLNDDAARYERMAAQLAQEGSSAEVARLRAEVMECRKQIEQLRAEVQYLRAKIERRGATEPEPLPTDSAGRKESPAPPQRSKQ